MNFHDDAGGFNHVLHDGGVLVDTAVDSWSHGALACSAHLHITLQKLHESASVLPRKDQMQGAVPLTFKVTI